MSPSSRKKYEEKMKKQEKKREQRGKNKMIKS
jgi:hypothetical protein